MSRCPSCGTSLSGGAVLCVACGFHLKEGKHLATEGATPADIEPAAKTAAPTQSGAGNPYQSPAADPKAVLDKGRLRHNYDLPTRISYLEDRVRELERRVDSTWLLSPNFFMRMLAAWGFVMLANALIWSVIFALTLALRGGF